MAKTALLKKLQKKKKKKNKTSSDSKFDSDHWNEARAVILIALFAVFLKISSGAALIEALRIT